MDLISRKAALEAAKIPNGEYPNPSERHGIIIARVEARRRIREIPSFPAVPLDKLCEWLAKFGCPCALNGGICDQHGVFHCVGYGKSNVFCWRYLLTKWMEEQDAAD